MDASIIYDNNCLRSRHGQVIGWIESENMFSFFGQHKGWFKNGVFYDMYSRPIGFLSDTTEELPSKLKTFGEFMMPNFPQSPNRPKLTTSLNRMKTGGWSAYLFEEYLATN